jgi:hypothetical protein
MARTKMVISKSHRCRSCNGWDDSESEEFLWFGDAQESMKLLTAMLTESGWDLLGAMPTRVELERLDGDQYDTACLELILQEEN